MEHVEGSPGRQTRRTRLLNAFHARRAARSAVPASFVRPPEPRSIGSADRGARLLAGEFLFAGKLIEAPDTAIWDIAAPDAAFEAARQGFGWLDDLAAVGDRAARETAQRWTRGWIERYGRGAGPGWTPDLAGRRLIRWIDHAAMLLHRQDKAQVRAYRRVLGAQTLFLARRANFAMPGLARIEALAGLICASLALRGQERHLANAVRALSRECAVQIDAGGGLRSRNPEALLEVFSLLVRTARTLSDAGHRPGDTLDAAIKGIAPTLRALRHADGALARFHGGGGGQEGRIDLALATSGIRPAPQPEALAMGFARLAAGRTTVIIDAAPPPPFDATPAAHASTLAFELTSGRRPMVVNCGSGARFGDIWRRAGRARRGHSTLEILDSATPGMAMAAPGAAGPELHDLAREVRCQITANSDVRHLLAGHDGYMARYGLTHVRQLDLTRDGRRLDGEDTLGAVTAADREILARDLAKRGEGVDFVVRFHLHPDVEAALETAENAARLALLSGETWRFRVSGPVSLKLEPSLYLDPALPKPVGCRQIVLSGRVIDTACQINWTLAKTEDTPRAIRDVLRDAGDEDPYD